MLNLRLALYAAAALMCASLGWKLHDWTVYQPHLRADMAAAKRVSDAVKAASSNGFDAGMTARDAADDTQTKVRTVTIETVRKVPVYVTKTVTIAAPDGPVAVPAAVSVGFGLLHNYAAAGIAPPASPAPGIDLSADSGAGMPDLAQTVVSNYGQCHAAIAEVKAWRGWYDDVLVPWWQRADAAITKAGK